MYQTCKQHGLLWIGCRASRWRNIRSLIARRSAWNAIAVTNCRIRKANRNCHGVTKSVFNLLSLNYLLDTENDLLWSRRILGGRMSVETSRRGMGLRGVRRMAGVVTEAKAWLAKCLFTELSIITTPTVRLLPAIECGHPSRIDSTIFAGKTRKPGDVLCLCLYYRSSQRLVDHVRAKSRRFLNKAIRLYISLNRF